MLRPVMAAFAALLLVVACAAQSISTTPSDPSAVIDPSGGWVLVEGTADGQPLVLRDAAPVTFNVEGSQVSGRSGCNQYFGEFGLAGGRVTLGQLGGTEMACEEPLMALEAAYLAGLATVDSARMDAGQLVLTGPGTELHFQRVDPPPTAQMIGTQWRLESLVQADAVSSTVGDPATLMLNADGSFQGSTGCRSLIGRYTIDGAEIVATDLTAEGECPLGVAAQDAQVIEVIGDGFRAAVDGDQLFLGKDDGSGLVYRAVE
jgi:heat shock protein HslJ